MIQLFLTRAALRRDKSLLALANVLVPKGGSVKLDASHRLVWSLFADSTDRKRDYLWRAKSQGGFLILSQRPPVDRNGLFDLESKTFAPSLRVGQRLRFSLRANPVVAIAPAPGQRGKRHDVVMHALRSLPKEQRAAARRDTIASAGHAWLDRQGARAGFRLEGDVGVDGYEQVRIPRETGPAMKFSVLDFDGVLTVTDPGALLGAMAQGFGRARAFGCGLMLIAPARA